MFTFLSQASKEVGLDGWEEEKEKKKRDPSHPEYLVGSEMEWVD